MASNAVVMLRIRVAWWFKPYVWGLMTTSWLTGLEPDWEKFGKVVERAVSLEPVRV